MFSHEWFCTRHHFNTEEKTNLKMAYYNIVSSDIKKSDHAIHKVQVSIDCTVSTYKCL